MSGEDVRNLQLCPIQLGYLQGEADGKFGEKTASAVKGFQMEMGLKVDGIVGSQTKRLLVNPEPLTENISLPMDSTMRDVRNVTAVVTSQISLNLRTGCSTDCRLLTEMPRGSNVTVLKRGDKWCEVRYLDIVGYCMTKYLKF